MSVSRWSVRLDLSCLKVFHHNLLNFCCNQLQSCVVAAIGIVVVVAAVCVASLHLNLQSLFRLCSALRSPIYLCNLLCIDTIDQEPRAMSAYISSVALIEKLLKLFTMLRMLRMKTDVFLSFSSIGEEEEWRGCNILQNACQAVPLSITNSSRSHSHRLCYKFCSYTHRNTHIDTHIHIQSESDIDTIS